MAQIPKLKSSKKYYDAPRYKLIYDYEGQFKRNFAKSIDQSLKDIGQQLAKFSK